MGKKFRENNNLIDDVYKEDEDRVENPLDFFANFSIEKPMGYDDDSTEDTAPENETSAHRAQLSSVNHDPAASLDGVEDDLRDAMKSFPKQDDGEHEFEVEVTAIETPKNPIIMDPYLMGKKDMLESGVVLKQDTWINERIVKKGSRVRLIKEYNDDAEVYGALNRHAKETDWKTNHPEAYNAWQQRKKTPAEKIAGYLELEQDLDDLKKNDPDSNRRWDIVNAMGKLQHKHMQFDPENTSY
jgi:hypothetical protein